MQPGSPELAAVAEFVRHCLPFERLDGAQLDYAVHHMSVRYHRAQSFFSPDDPPVLRLIRSGAVDLRDGGRLLDRLGEGEHFFLPGLLEQMPALQAQVIEDSLCYELPAEAYRRLRADNRAFDRYFHRQRARRLRRAVRDTPVEPLLLQRVDELMRRELLVLPTDASAADAARAMTARRLSSVLVMNGERLAGIVTDRDLRSRVLAAGRGGDTPLADIMTAAPLTLPAGASLFDALLQMTQSNCHHLPIVDAQGRPCGMLAGSDLMRARSRDPVHLVQAISRQDSAAEVAAVVAGLPDLLRQWLSGGARAEQLGRVLTAVSDAAARRLLQLAERELGPPPAAYTWLAFGSQGRAEQALGADQDNGLIVADDAPADADLYFEALAQRVCAGLERCGYALCRGGIMATTEAWRQPLRHWQRTVMGWAAQPTPEAVMRVSIFFDIRAVAGANGLVRELQQSMLDTARDQIFLAALARNALTHTPPLGFFRRFVLEHGGEHRDQLDLKHRGIIPIVDLVRVRALAAGVDAVNSLERLRALHRAGAMTLVDSRNLLDAWESIAQQRFRLQSRQVREGAAVSNFLDPATLPDLEREQLRDAFQIVHAAQQALKLNFVREL